MPARFATPAVIEQITDEHERWSDLLRSFAPADWQRATACEGWSVKHIVAHVVSGIDFYRESIGNALNGDVEPIWPDGRAGRQAAFERCLELDDARLIDAFDEAANLLDKTLMKVAEDDAELPAWHPSGTWTLDRMIGGRLADSAIHRWDMAHGADAGARLDSDRLPFLLDYVDGGIGRYVVPADFPQGGSWRFDLTSPIDEAVVIRVKDGATSLERNGQMAAEQCVADPNDFLLLLLRRKPLADAIAQGGIRDLSNRDAFESLASHLRFV